MSKSIALGLVGAGAVLLAILLTGCSDEPSPTPSAGDGPSPTVTAQPGVTREPTSPPTTAVTDREETEEIPVGGSAGDRLDEPGEPGASSADADRAALTVLYYTLDGANWRRNTSWLSEQPLRRWYGVDTDSNGRVTALSLSGNRLSGSRTLTIPAGRTVSVASVTITGVDNGDQTDDVSVTVSATAANTSSLGVVDPEPVALVIADDETTPVVTLSLSPSEIAEHEGRTFVTAMLDSRSSADTISEQICRNERVHSHLLHHHKGWQDAATS